MSTLDSDERHARRRVHELLHAAFEVAQETEHKDRGVLKLEPGEPRLRVCHFDIPDGAAVIFYGRPLDASISFEMPVSPLRVVTVRVRSTEFTAKAVVKDAARARH